MQLNENVRMQFAHVCQRRLVDAISNIFGKGFKLFSYRFLCELKCFLNVCTSVKIKRKEYQILVEGGVIVWFLSS